VFSNKNVNIVIRHLLLWTWFLLHLITSLCHPVTFILFTLYSSQSASDLEQLPKDY